MFLFQREAFATTWHATGTVHNGTGAVDEGSSLETITIVTAFFDIGSFGKGNPNKVLTLNTYLHWATTFRYLQNPLVVYTDSRKFLDTMKALRSKLSDKTKLLLIDRNSSWAFQKRDIIKDIYAIEGYPKYYPNTVVPEYSCAMHAKYDVVSRAIKENYFHTKYFAWLDVGLFRDEVNNTRNFILQLPESFNASKIAVDLVFKAPMNTDISRIFLRKMDWVCGCFFLGERNLLLQYTEQYKKAVDYFLSRKLMNSDQQVLYAMYSMEGQKVFHPNISLQLYKSDNSGYNPWFYLGYIMRKWV